MLMHRVAAVGAAVAVALGAPAAAQAKSHTKVLRGSFKLVGADGMYTSDRFGKAQLVDGKRNDQLSVHVRRLGARTTYVYKLQSTAAATACAAGAPGGTDVPGWRYRHGGVLKTNRHGVANSFARSRSFTAASDVTYFVGVWSTTATGAPDQLVACAQLKGNRKPAKSHGGGKSHDKPHGGGKGHGHGNGNGKANGNAGNGGGHDGGDKGNGGGHGHGRAVAAHRVGSR
jgi:hypothetical protein